MPGIHEEPWQVLTPSTPQPPLSLYVHIPFCAAKCPYCDFASRALPQAQRATAESTYLEALGEELRAWRQWLAADTRPLSSLFIGGGTPSLFSGVGLAGLLNTVRQLWPLTADCEITTEANPESLEPAFLDALRPAGLNRLSLGVQALDDNRLRSLGRPHDLNRALQALAWAQRAGVPQVSIDLIYATPNQTPEAWREELRRACDLPVTHLSCYALTLAEGTPFHRQAQHGLLRSLDGDQAAALFHLTHDILAHDGFPAYEVSNFAPRDNRCRHNLNYWTGGDFLGVGVSAHGRLTARDGGTRHYYENPSTLTEYLAARQRDPQRPCATSAPCSRRESAIDCLLMGLRLVEGMSWESYQRQADSDLRHTHGDELHRLEQEGWIRMSPTHLALTREGLAMADGVIVRLMPE
ncbi:MAG: radical SAM family heme chaperone HemW [Magnetococcus sp. WYHC-3]